MEAPSHALAPGAERTSRFSEDRAEDLELQERGLNSDISQQPIPQWQPGHTRNASQSALYRENDSLLSNGGFPGAAAAEKAGTQPDFIHRFVYFFTGSKDRIWKRLLPAVAILIAIIIVGLVVPLTVGRKKPGKGGAINTPSGNSTGNIPMTEADAFNNQPRLVFAHYMLITRPPNGNYTDDILLAKAAGIDAFAVNYGGVKVDYDAENTFLSEFYNYCADHGMSAFISFDATSTDQDEKLIEPKRAVDLFNEYNDHKAQLKVDNKAVLSTFQTADPPWDWNTDVLAHLNASVQFIPSSLSTNGKEVFGQNDGAEGYFSWIHHDMNATAEAATDAGFASARNQSATTPRKDDGDDDKDGTLKWMAGLSPWFYKNLGAHWANAQDSAMFVPRIQNLLRRKPDFLQLVTWNDYGESTYFGPVNSNLSSICPDCYYAHLEHGGFLEVMKPVIRAYKNGDTDVEFDEEKDKENVWLFYRLQPAKVEASANEGNSTGLPDKADSLEDKIFVISFMKGDAVVKVSGKGNDGKDNERTVSVKEGLSVTAVDWAWGNQTVTAVRGSTTIVQSKTGPEIVANPERYNGNVVVV